MFGILDVSMCVQIKKPLKPYQEEHVKEQKKLGRVCDMTEEPRRTRAPKAVDEDLYKIPPELLHEKPKRVGGPTFFCSFLFFSYENSNFLKHVAHGLLQCYWTFLHVYTCHAPTI